ncbi:MAG: Fe-Mn family superoxide dismutase [Rickettsiales bacterium]|jgi:Fe-Mn family superoxide dismutase
MGMIRRKFIKTISLTTIFGTAGFFLTRNNFHQSINFNQSKKGKIMTFELPKLPYAKNALEPHISENTLNFHYGKHHQAYVTNLNKLVDGTDLAGKSLEEVIKISAADSTKDGIFNNAAQVWNHTFYWNSMKPNGGGKPTGDLLAKIEADFGSFENFASEFKTAGATQFGSGWAWLVLEDGKLKVTKTANALTPLTTNATPLLTMDVWEHAYYLDFQNARPTYMESFLSNLINWEFAAENLKNA